MFEIREVSAAPHFPEPLKPGAPTARPENVVALLTLASEGEANVEVTVHEGEIFIALTAS